MSQENRESKELVAVVTEKDGEHQVVPEYIYKQYYGDNNTNPTNQITDDTFKEKYEKTSIVRPLVNPKQLAGLLEINTYHNRCVRTKAQDIAGNGYEIRKKHEDADVSEKEFIQEFFDNQFPPIEETLTQAEIDYGAIGYSCFELVKAGNSYGTKYQYINHIPAHSVRLTRIKNKSDFPKYVQKRANKFVYFKHPLMEKDVDKDTGEVYPLGELSDDKRANDIIFMKNYTPRSDYYGLPDIITALGAIWGNLAQQRYNNEFFKNFGIPQYAVYITGDYNLKKDEDGNPEIVTRIQEHLSSVRRNPHSTLVFGIPSSTPGMGENVKVEFKELANRSDEASFRMFREDNREEVVIAHGVPGNRIGLADVASLGGDTAYETNRIYKESSINPRQKEIEEYINKYIIQHNFEIYDWEVKLKNLDIDSTEKDKEILDFLFTNGSATPNDLIRNLGADYGIEPGTDIGLDEYFMNFTPLVNVMEGGDPEEKAEVPEQPEQPEEGITEKMNELSEQDLVSLLRALKDRLEKGDD